jgi:hypothetical protein
MNPRPDVASLASDSHEHEQRAWFYSTVAALLSSPPSAAGHEGASRGAHGHSARFGGPPCAPWCSRNAARCPQDHQGFARAQARAAGQEGGPIGDLAVLGALAEEYAQALTKDPQRASWLCALQHELLQRSGQCLDLLAQELAAWANPLYVRVGRSLAARVALDRAIFLIRA